MGARSGEREGVVVLVLVLVVAVVVVVVLRFSKEGHLLLQILCDDPDDILLDRHVLEVEQLAVTRGHRHCPRRRSAGRSRKSEKLPSHWPKYSTHCLRHRTRVDLARKPPFLNDCSVDVESGAELVRGGAGKQKRRWHEHPYTLF